MKNKRIIILRIVIIILILCWMNLVFGFSAQDSDDSSNLSTWVASWFTKDVEVQSKIEPYIRKLAHYSEYAIGGTLFFSLIATFKINEFKQIIFAIIMGIIYAITDEIHQLFVPGRSGQIKDVFIDSLGVITGVLVMKLIIILLGKLIVKPKNKVE